MELPMSRPNDERGVRANAAWMRRVRERRRVAFGAGVGVMLATAAAAAALGTGCIFDEGNYQGGGRRSTAPTATDTSTDTIPEEPTTSAPTTPSSTSTSPGDSGAQLPDTGALDN